MSVTIEQLAAELNTEPDVVVDTARQLLSSGEEMKVLTVGPSPGDASDSVACLTDAAADTIRARFRPT